MFFNQQVSRLSKLWRKLAFAGANDTDNQIQKLQVGIFNMITYITYVPNILYLTNNLLNQRYVLAITNASFVVFTTLLIWLHWNRSFVKARVGFLYVNLILLSIQAVFYRNGSEMLLLVNLIVSVIFFKNKRFIILFGIASGLLYLSVYYLLLHPPIYQEVSDTKKMVNATMNVILFLFTIQFFKFEQTSYLNIIEEQNKELGEANKAKEKLFSIVAHDLRGPIGQLKMSLEMVQLDHMSQAEFASFGDLFIKQLDQLQGNMDSLLRWSFSQLNGISVSASAVEVNAAATTVMSLLEHQFRSKNLSVHIDVQPAKLWVDEQHLLLVIRNLLSNATKYSFKGGNVYIDGQVQNEKYVLRVTDEGVGIPVAKQASLLSTSAVQSTMGTESEKGTAWG